MVTEDKLTLSFPFSDGEQIQFDLGEFSETRFLKMLPGFFAELKILFSQYDLFFPSFICASINAAKAFTNVSFFSSG